MMNPSQKVDGFTLLSQLYPSDCYEKLYLSEKKNDGFTLASKLYPSSMTAMKSSRYRVNCNLNTMNKLTLPRLP